MFIFLSLLFSIILLKQLLFWIYLWQLKGYRYDRFSTEYGKAATLVRLWISTGGRKLRYPIFTLKAILISLLSLAAIATPWYFSLNASSSNSTLFVYFLYLFFGAPLLISLIVWIVNIPSAIAKSMIYNNARRKRDSMHDLIVVGITGSYGKSSTKEFLFRMLSRKFNVQKTPENINSEIGIAKFIIDELKPDTEIFIVEMGAYRIGEIKRSCDIAKPGMAILTGLNEQHLGLFGSLANIKKAKFELIESLPPEGFAAFNGENEYCREFASRWPGKKTLYKSSDVSIGFDLPKHYALNIAGAAAVAEQLGVNESQIQDAIESLRQDPIDGNVIKKSIGRGGVVVIDDTYSENPDGIIAALDYLASQEKKTKILVMPCIIELGDSASSVHERVGKKIAAVCDSAIIITKDYFSDIQKTAGAAAVLEVDPLRVIDLLRDNANADTAILLEGRMPKTITNFLEL